MEKNKKSIVNESIPSQDTTTTSTDTIPLSTIDHRSIPSDTVVVSSFLDEPVGSNTTTHSTTITAVEDISNSSGSNNSRSPGNNLSNILLVCDICKDTRYTIDNQIIPCKGPCGLATHQRCYGIVWAPITRQETYENTTTYIINDGDWVCYTCYYLPYNIINHSSSVPVHTTSTKDSLFFLPSCWLCRQTRNSLMKPCNESERIMKSKREYKKELSQQRNTNGTVSCLYYEDLDHHYDRLMVHMICALACPSIYFENIMRMEGIEIDPDSFIVRKGNGNSTDLTKNSIHKSYACVFCKSTQGFMLSCSIRSCRNHYHPVCGANNSLRIELRAKWIDPDGDFADYRKRITKGYCHNHQNDLVPPEKINSLHEDCVYGLHDGIGVCNYTVWKNTYKCYDQQKEELLELFTRYKDPNISEGLRSKIRNEIENFDISFLHASTRSKALNSIFGHCSSKKTVENTTDATESRKSSSSSSVPAAIVPNMLTDNLLRHESSLAHLRYLLYEHERLLRTKISLSSSVTTEPWQPSIFSNALFTYLQNKYPLIGTLHGKYVWWKNYTKVKQRTDAATFDTFTECFSINGTNNNDNNDGEECIDTDSLLGNDNDNIDGEVDVHKPNLLVSSRSHWKPKKSLRPNDKPYDDGLGSNSLFGRLQDIHKYAALSWVPAPIDITTFMELKEMEDKHYNQEFPNYSKESPIVSSTPSIVSRTTTGRSSIGSADLSIVQSLFSGMTVNEPSSTNLYSPSSSVPTVSMNTTSNVTSDNRSIRTRRQAAEEKLSRIEKNIGPFGNGIVGSDNYDWSMNIPEPNYQYTGEAVKVKWDMIVESKATPVEERKDATAEPIDKYIIPSPVTVLHVTRVPLAKNRKTNSFLTQGTSSSSNNVSISTDTIEKEIEIMMEGTYDTTDNSCNTYETQILDVAIKFGHGDHDATYDLSGTSTATSTGPDTNDDNDIMDNDNTLNVSDKLFEYFKQVKGTITNISGVLPNKNLIIDNSLIDKEDDNEVITEGTERSKEYISLENNCSSNNLTEEGFPNLEEDNEITMLLSALEVSLSYCRNHRQTTQQLLNNRWLKVINSTVSEIRKEIERLFYYRLFCLLYGTCDTCKNIWKEECLHRTTLFQQLVTQAEKFYVRSGDSNRIHASLPERNENYPSNRNNDQNNITENTLSSFVSTSTPSTVINNYPPSIPYEEGTLEYLQYYLAIPQKEEASSSLPENTTSSASASLTIEQSWEDWLQTWFGYLVMEPGVKKYSSSSLSGGSLFSSFSRNDDNGLSSEPPLLLLPHAFDNHGWYKFPHHMANIVIDNVYNVLTHQVNNPTTDTVTVSNLSSGSGTSTTHIIRSRSPPSSPPHPSSKPKKIKRKGNDRLSRLISSATTRSQDTVNISSGELLMYRIQQLRSDSE